MSWYNNNTSGWYKPNVCTQAGQAAPAPQTGAVPPAAKKNTRVVAVIICLCVLIAGIWLVAAGFGAENISYNEDGRPTDWHDYMDSIYDSTSTVSAVDVKIPLADDRGSLTLKQGGSGAALDFSRIYEKCVPSVVGIKVFEGENTDYYGWGSGVIASEDGYIITNTHVIDGGDSATVVLYDGSEYDARLIGFDATSDVALLKIDATGLTAAEFASSSELKVGDSVAAIGNPLSPDLRLTMTRGIVSALNREINYNGASMSLIQTDASINEGNSGGPLFNDRGEVIGITNMKMISTFGAGIEGLGFAIPSDTVQSIVASLISDGKVTGRSSIGVTIGPISENIAKYYDIPQGLYVSYVTKGSDAEKQGLREGDIITKVNGEDAFTTQDVADAKSGLEIGDSISFTVWRDGRTFEVSVKIMDSAEMGK